MARLLQTALLLSCFLVAGNALAATYYIDYAGGSDSNSGTSKTSPWKHAPGMTGCGGNCSSANPSAGDSFILKGGVTWPNAALGWDWNWSGSGSTSSPGCSGSGCIYIGVDSSWYSGSSWARPIIDAGGAQVASTNAGTNVMLRLYANYVKLDNLEFTGLHFGGTEIYGQNVNIVLAAGSANKGMHVELANLYIHGWSHDSNTHEHACGVVGDTAIPNNNANSSLHDSVISGADTAKNSCSAVFGAPPFIYNNEMEYVTSCMITNGGVQIHDNVCENLVSSFDSGAHLNGLENNASNDIAIYNNVFRHMASGALTIWSAPNQGHTSYIFNNVLYDTDVNNILDLAAPVANNGCAQGNTYCTRGGTEIVFNNTIECGPDSNPNAICAANINAANTAVTLANNHFISNASSYWSTNGVTPTLSANVLQSKSQANAQGYSASEAYAFSPVSAYPASATPGRGASASSLCSATGIAACGDDTTYGITYERSSHTVSSGARSASAWNSPPDVGAYAYGGTSADVQPPTGLSATVR